MFRFWYRIDWLMMIMRVSFWFGLILDLVLVFGIVYMKEKELEVNNCKNA